eukprot:365601-Chlamydomonas_euryale.AAC.4
MLPARCWDVAVGMLLARCWHVAGVLLACCWHVAGALLARCWRAPGMLLACCCWHVAVGMQCRARAACNGSVLHMCPAPHARCDAPVLSYQRCDMGSQDKFCHLHETRAHFGAASFMSPHCTSGNTERR